RRWQRHTGSCRVRVSSVCSLYRRELSFHEKAFAKAAVGLLRVAYLPRSIVGKTTDAIVLETDLVRYEKVMKYLFFPAHRSSFFALREVEPRELWEWGPGERPF